MSYSRISSDERAHHEEVLANINRNDANPAVSAKEIALNLILSEKWDYVHVLLTSASVSWLEAVQRALINNHGVRSAQLDRGIEGTLLVSAKTTKALTARVHGRAAF